MANIQAIITAVDSPKTGWYGAKILTNPSVTVYAVSLLGTLFKVGQMISVIQYKSWDQSPEFGFCEYGLYKSLVYIAPQKYDSITNASKANTALAYIANVSGNIKRLYNPAIVTSVNSNTLTVRDRVTGSTPTLMLTTLTPQDFSVDDGCLIGLDQNRILGYWQTTKSVGGDKIPWMFIYRVPFTTDFQIGVQAYDNSGPSPSYPILKQNTIFGTDPIMDFASSASIATTNDDVYIYSQLNYRQTFGGATDVKYIKWHKKTLAYEFISAGEMPTGAGYNLAYGGKDALGNDKPQKPWVWQSAELQQSDTVSPLTWYKVLALNTVGTEFFPYQNYEYKEWGT